MIGILGGGQLGRMLALAGYPLGLRCRFLEPASEPSAGQVSECLQAEFEDYQALFRFIQDVSCVTYEFENVPVETAQWVADRVPVYPPPQALAVAQDRVREKTFFQNLGIPVPPFLAVNHRTEFETALQKIGLPAVLKTTRFGYDGKGQAVLRNSEEAENAWKQLGGRPLILEGFVPFQRELSILAVRSRTGEMVFYPLVENHHRLGMLRLSIAPAPQLAATLQKTAEDYARRALEALDYVGVLAIEMFECHGQLCINEMAPRVHNSGHWTIEGAETSQFENHLRAVAGLPLGSTIMPGHALMWNLISTLPESQHVLALPGTHLHLYGKQPRPNRKIGHITITANHLQQLRERQKALEAIVGTVADIH